MIIAIKVPKWIDRKVKNELYTTIKSICRLLSDDEIKVVKEDEWIATDKWTRDKLFTKIEK